MSCPHTETTAVLAAFGEAPADFEAHLRTCPACLDVVRQHTSTLATIEPILNSSHTPTARWRLPAVGVLIAAVGLLTLQAPSNEGQSIQNQTLTMEVDLFDDPIDENLSTIELEIELFHLEET